jgi:hypothetical protein
MKVKVVTGAGLSRKQKDLIERASRLLEKILVSPQFTSKVLNYKYKDRYGQINKGFHWPFFYHANGATSPHLSNQGVLDKILSGAEQLNPELDGEVDIFIRIYEENSDIIGYTYPDTKWQWINKWVFSSFDEVDIAGNLMHEWCHKLGFDHEYEYTKWRQHSVPYAIGYIAEEVGRDLL